MYKITNRKVSANGESVYKLEDEAGVGKSYNLGISAIKTILSKESRALRGIQVKDGVYLEAKNDTGYNIELVQRVLDELNGKEVDNSKDGTGIYIRGVIAGNTPDNFMIEISENNTVRKVSVAELKKIISKQNVNGIKETVKVKSDDGSGECVKKDVYVVSSKVPDCKNIDRLLNGRKPLINVGDVEHINKSNKGTLRAFKSNGYWGAVDESLEMVIPAVYDDYVNNPANNILQFKMVDKNTKEAVYIALNAQNTVLAVSKRKIKYEDKELITYNDKGEQVYRYDTVRGVRTYTMDEKCGKPIIVDLDSVYKKYVEYKHKFDDKGNIVRGNNNEFSYEIVDTFDKVHRKPVLHKVPTGYDADNNRTIYSYAPVIPSMEYDIIDGLNFNMRGVGAVEYEYDGDEVWSFIDRNGDIVNSNRVITEVNNSILYNIVNEYTFKRICSLNDNFAVVVTLDNRYELYSICSNKVLSKVGDGYSFLDSRIRNKVNGFDQIVEVGDKYFIRYDHRMIVVRNDTLRLVNSIKYDFNFEITGIVDYGVLIRTSDGKYNVMTCNGSTVSACWFNEYKHIGKYDMFEMEDALWIYVDKQIVKLCPKSARLGMYRDEIYSVSNGQIYYMIPGVAKRIQLTSDSNIKEITDLYDESTVRVIEFENGKYKWIATENCMTNNKEYDSRLQLMNDKLLNYREIV